MTDIVFKPFPKIPRLNRGMTVTEKIDGTNAAVGVIAYPFGTHADWERNGGTLVLGSELGSDLLPIYEYVVYAQSRNRLITPEADNAGFAKWVAVWAEDLARVLGEGIHYGEWWGGGIQRSYGQTVKRFSLFNTKRWGDGLGLGDEVPGLTVVPVLYEGPFSDEFIVQTVSNLRDLGSAAAPGFMRPEGVVVFHHASRSMFKVLCENDELPKSAVVPLAGPVPVLTGAVEVSL